MVENNDTWGARKCFSFSIWAYRTGGTKMSAVAIRTAPVRRPPFAIRTGVSISSLVALVSVEFHSLGLGS